MPVVPKNILSVHTVERGDMPIRLRAVGAITSLQPPRAVVTITDTVLETCQPDQSASAQIEAPNVIRGRVVSAHGSECEIEFAQSLPASVATGTKLGAMIDAGAMHDVVFLERPADAAAGTDSSIFVIEPGDGFARRAAVHYGRISGSLIQVVSGLAPGDRVIVTDMSKWMASPRVRLE